MARPMNPLPPGNDTLVTFAASLRVLREDAGQPSLAVMAQRCDVSTAALCQAHSGKTVPSWRSVRGYVTACRGNPVDWRARWETLNLTDLADQSSKHGDLIKRWARVGQILPPRRIESEAELTRLLNSVRTFRGLSLRDLQRRAPGYSHHTYGAMLRGERPVTADILQMFLNACGVEMESLKRWLRLLVQIRPQEEFAAMRLLAALHSEHRNWRRSSPALTFAVEQLERRVKAARPPHRSAAKVQALRAATVDVLRLLDARVVQPYQGENLSVMTGRLIREIREGRNASDNPYVDRLVEAALPSSVDRGRVTRALDDSTALLAAQHEALRRASTAPAKPGRMAA